MNCWGSLTQTGANHGCKSRKTDQVVLPIAVKQNCPEGGLGTDRNEQGRNQALFGGNKTEKTPARVVETRGGGN